VGIGALFPGVKQPGYEADHSPPSRAWVKNMWSYTSTSHTPSWQDIPLWCGTYVSTAIAVPLPI